MRHGVQTVEEARHDDPRRRGLSGKGAQGFRHALRRAAILFHQHPHEAEPFRREGADRLLPPGSVRGTSTAGRSKDRISQKVL